MNPLKVQVDLELTEAAKALMNKIEACLQAGFLSGVKVAGQSIARADLGEPVFNRIAAQEAIAEIRTTKVISCGMADRCATQLEAAIAMIDAIPHDVLVAMCGPRVP